MDCGVVSHNGFSKRRPLPLGPRDPCQRPAEPQHRQAEVGGGDWESRGDATGVDSIGPVLCAKAAEGAEGCGPLAHCGESARTLSEVSGSLCSLSEGMVSDGSSRAIISAAWFGEAYLGECVQINWR